MFIFMNVRNEPINFDLLKIITPPLLIIHKVIAMTHIRNFLVLVIAFFFIFSSSAFSQSTPPLDKPVEKSRADQISEPGRTQEGLNAKRNGMGSTGSNENHPTSKLHNRSSQQQPTGQLNQFEKDSGIDDAILPGRSSENRSN